MIERIKIFFTLSSMLLVLTGLSCDETITIPEPDTIPPQASILFPIDGEPVSGEIEIQARANDNDRVDSVAFYINQKFVGFKIQKNGQFGQEDQTIFTFNWDTENSELYAEDEFQFISVEAVDPVGNG